MPHVLAVVPAFVETTSSAEWRWLDWIGVGLVVVIALVGARHGTWWQLVRLLGLAATIAVARALAPALAGTITGAFPGLDAHVAEGLAWIGLIGGGLLAVALVLRWTTGAPEGEPAPPGFLDRIGGAIAGGASGALLHAALLLCIAHVAPSEWAQARVRGSHSQQLLATLGNGVPGLVDARASDSLGLGNTAR